MERIRQLEAWVARQVGAAVALAPASADASFRSYWRLRTGERTLIAMDAPPAHEDCRPFVHVARLFAGAGVHVPEILADYRVHGGSMLRTETDKQANKAALIAEMERRHTWLRIARPDRTNDHLA